MRNTFSLFFLFISSSVLFSQNLSIHPVAQQIYYDMHQDDFTVQVRLLGERDWQDLFEYKVEVDPATKSVASMVQFDFEGKVEMKVKVNNGMVHHVDIRPYSENIAHEVVDNIVYFTLENPQKLSLEVNKNRLNNLHIFANGLEKEIPEKSNPDVIWFGPGVHRPGDQPGRSFTIPSNKTVYLAPGAIVDGKFICNNVENVRFIGRGIVRRPQRGFEITHSKNIEIDGITVINPEHYSVFGGESSEIKIKNLKSFSNRGWGDGIDLMSCKNVKIEDVFLRTSDDCIALYAHRWNYHGDVENIEVKDAVLWADVAHPINIGGQGNYQSEIGDRLSNLTFRNIDILEHDERDRDYQGCMAIDVGDNNRVCDVLFENIRVESIQEGRLFTVKIRFNEKYNHKPGKSVENVIFRNIHYTGPEPNPSVIEGFSANKQIKNILFENIFINNKKALSLEDADIRVNQFTNNITIK